jgi:intracellular septation protein
MQILLELTPLVAFFVGYRMHGLYFATAVLMVVMALVLLVDMVRERRIPVMHGVSAALVFLFGSATLLLHNQRYIQWKPTVLFWLISLAFLASFWIGERPLADRLLGQMLGSTVEVPRSLARRLNWLWVGFCAALGVLNLAVAFRLSERTWVSFKVIGLPIVTTVFIALQILWIWRRVPAAAGGSTAG